MTGARPYEGTPHRRWDPLAARWVVVSPDRTDRPWQGAEEDATTELLPRHDPACYLCPGGERANGAVNPDYSSTFVFTNDFAALRPEPGPLPAADDPLRRAEPVAGTCRVLCFSPRHDLTMARMDVAEVRTVVDLWAEQAAELEQRWSYVQVFENRGEAMGASNPHPHGQLWALDVVPGEPAREDETQRAWFEQRGTTLLGDVVATEAGGPRVVVANDGWVALVPWWATWPFEVLVLPRRRVARLSALGHDQRDDLADVLRRLLVAYDNLFEHPFPYSMGWHQAPGTGDPDHWTLHAHFYPPLLRSASVRKWMVGFEMLADVQRDLTAEEAAERLRAAAGTHYLAGVTP